ncbi:MAG: hypothetical protein KDB31_02590 [Microthrixaceae bacterium]|nr:hypothetical protein [Microthrixaceae bacterium]
MSRRQPTVAVVGVGVLGGRLARELLSGPAPPVVTLHSSREDRREALASALRDARDAGLVRIRDRSEDVAGSVQVVVLTGDQESQVTQAASHLEAGRHVVTTVDGHDPARALLAMDAIAREAGRSLVVGSCFSPGLSDVLVNWAAKRFDVVDEVHFARHGAGGPNCARDRLEALRRPAHEWRDGTWLSNRPGSGRELCWFPDPVGGRDSYLADTAEPAIAVAAHPELRRSSARIVMNRRDRLAQYLPLLVPAPAEGGVGALRVEIRGSIGSSRETRVFGVLDRPATAAAALTAEVTLHLLTGSAPSGAIGAGSVMDPSQALRKCRRRGVRVAELGAAWSDTGEPSRDLAHPE